MKKALLFLGLLVVYVAFLPALALVYLSVLAHALTGDSKRASRAFNAINRAVSTLFGGDGSRSTSHTAGVRLILKTADWRHCLLCKVLDVFETDHCRKEAEDDPLVRR